MAAGALAACASSPGNLRSVRGTISGLSGTGLVLLLNGGGALSPAPGAATFRFDTVVGEGSEYRVTVGTQPTSPTQTCVVTGGSGTAGSADVSDVAVSCTPNAYGIGGLVAGLQGSGLRLHLDGQPDLAVGGDGSFAFPVPLVSGSSYAVTVAVQPGGPEQVCTVVRGSGQVVAASVTDVLVTCANALSVGGTVTGLQGVGLTLRLDGQAPLAVAGSGAFAFPGKVASGAAYQVTVVQQPTSPWQTCTVANGAGTATADVTSVAVTCTTNTYAVGGVLSGLQGTGLTLRLNGQGPVAIAANGAFAFAGLVASGGAYTVTVGTQPSGPTQTCVVAGGTGTVTSADVTSVAVTCTINTYAVGGVVSGLQGAGLSVRLNGQTDLAVSANGAFAFPGRLPSGASYAVTVASQPVGPLQVCAVPAGTGTVVSSDVVVAVSCALVPPTLTGPLDQSAYQGATATFTVTASGNGPFSYRWQRGTVVLSANGPSLTISPATAADDGAVYSVLVTDVQGLSVSGSATLHLKTWTGFVATGPMALGREMATATLLPNGKVLLTGSRDLQAAELYDPVSGIFSPTGIPSVARTEHTATLLTGGKVLVAGGRNRFVAGFATAELYDPATGAFTATGSMSTIRASHTATLLASGKVLMTGGTGVAFTVQNTAELYDPTTGTFSAAGIMAAPRSGHSATSLADGSVLLVGGGLAMAELYIPAGTGTFGATGSLAGSRVYHTATRLADGRVAVIGGYNGGTLPGFLDVELYNPATFAFSSAGSISITRLQAAAALRADGKVLIAGGASDGSPSAELYDPATGLVSPAGSMGTARALFTLTPLPDGRMLAAGGRGPNFTEISTADLYQ